MGGAYATKTNGYWPLLTTLGRFAPRAYRERIASGYTLGLTPRPSGHCLRQRRISTNHYLLIAGREGIKNGKKEPSHFLINAR